MTILVAEIGWNFLGKLSLAKKMILEAKKAGSDAVKFQIWDPKYLKNGKWDYDGRRKIYEKAFLDEKKYKILKQFSKKNSIKCFASAFNLDGIKLLKKCGDKWIKIPSHEAYNFELITFALNNFQKIMISAGCLKKNELNKLIKLISSKKIYQSRTTLLHCVSSYPLKTKDCNFQKFKYIKSKLNKVGYSGHLQGIEDSVYALYNGAEIIEKHFTINNKLPGRDNKFALTYKDLSLLNNFRKSFEEFKINKGLDLQKCEIDIFKNYRGRWSKKIN
jgi:N,N'-diacetyllegionaminate synthase